MPRLERSSEHPSNPCERIANLSPTFRVQSRSRKSPSCSSNRSRSKAMFSRRGKSRGRIVWMCPLSNKDGGWKREVRIGIWALTARSGGAPPRVGTRYRAGARPNRVQLRITSWSEPLHWNCGAGSAEKPRVSCHFSRPEKRIDPLKTYPRLNDFSDQAGPSGLMGSANSSTTLPVEILMKVNVFAKMWVALEPIVLAEDRASALLIPRKKSRLYCEREVD